MEKDDGDRLQEAIAVLFYVINYVKHLQNLGSP